ncbi:cellulose biosynthesis cyclic di-GMP-binding regulatory protein BcsB [Methylovirgula sp. 4M-Z18]|uniref:cellulose biosynthesis cyclic di-GMP-binding regulatory protein BcsB n=1 Tax=Methylovirgula sp. 4M-Z18 TaxID=2293567 RepID=UPI000E2F2A7E|nr:cellulose biosynthesis cyclic di-GMP-binding regulatory protein BcsB [Methylovirgula sp. 4M-Z18]RFB78773.1 cellulose biosynthesis cyclic di-GMP-binding regulatory protein BcsB [Methylovirgula sp. 4M-Z18]
MRRLTSSAGLVAACLLTLSQAPYAAETTPFDMSPERSSKPVSSAPAITPEPSEPAAQSDNSQTAADAGSGRPILPQGQLALEGEIDARAWDVVLTKAQAETATTFNLGYRATLAVAPEASRLRVVVNDRRIFDTPITAPGTLTQVAIPVPQGVLNPGPNRFRLEAEQRHRTDCTIGSTYEMRTEIEGAATRLQFRAPNAGRLLGIEDLSAISPDDKGTTHLRIVVPALAKHTLIVPTLRFAQAAAILIGMPSQAITVAEKADTPADRDSVIAVIGSADDLKPLLARLPAQAFSQPVATFVDDPVLGPSTLIISGPTDQEVGQAVDAIGAMVDRPQGQWREALDTSRWFAPNPLLLLGASRVTLATLGVPTQEFSGRRFKTEFQIALPSDFYSSASGEAKLLLDAAYKADVLPNSHIDIFVNGNLAATTPLSAAGGGALQHLPVRLPMTHFQPGPNRITFVAELHTAADVECAAGPVKSGNHFALFDTSEFVIPDFAHIARLPNLAALQGTAFPYNVSSEPVALVLPDFNSDLVSAAATLLGRMAVAAGRLIPIDIDVPSSALPARNAIFIAPASQISETVSNQLDLDARMGSNWLAPEQSSLRQPAPGKMAAPANAVANTGNAADTQESSGQGRETASNQVGGWRGDISSFEDWLQRTFEFSGISLRLLPARPEPYQLPRDSLVVLAQGPSVSGDRAWTLLSAPTNELVRLGAEAITSEGQWFRLNGQAAAFNPRTSDIQTVPITTFFFLPTQPLTLGNLRLIAANWLSENILAFSLLLLTACMLLGLATALLLARIGRRGTG